MADIQVMVFPAEMFRGWPGRQAVEDHVTFTYAKAVSQAQAMRDFLAYSKIATKTLNEVQVRTDAASLVGARSPVMTCVTFTSAQVTDAQSGHFDIEPFVLALHTYKHLRLTFIAPSGFRFGGLRTFHDRRVDVEMAPLSSPASTTYTYDVWIKDGSFSALHLPTLQDDPVKQRDAIDRSNRLKRILLNVVGIVFICGVAGGVGYVVYNVFRRQVI